MGASRAPGLEDAAEELGVSMAALRLKGTEMLDQISEQFEQTCDAMEAHGHHVDVFRSEYHELYDSAVGSIEGAGTAGRKCEQLGQELASHRDKLSTIESQEEDAKSTRLNLSVTLETMHTSVKEIKEREVQRRAAAKTYYSEIEALKAELAQGPGWSEAQEELRKALLAEAGNLQRQLDLKQRDHEALRGDCDKLSGMIEVEDTKIAKLSDLLAEVDADRSELREASRKEVVRKSKQEAELLIYQEKMRKGQHVHREKQALLRTETTLITSLEQQLRDSKESIEEYLTQYDTLFHSIQKLGEELEQQIHQNTVINKDNAAKLIAANDRAAQAVSTTIEIEKLSKLKEAALTKIDATEAERHVLEAKRDELRTEMYHITSVDLKGERRKAEGLQRQLGDLQREKDILDRKYLSSDKAANLMFDLHKVNQNAHKNLGDEIGAFKASIREKRHTIDQLVTERQHHEAEASSHRAKYADRVEELKLQELEVSDLQQKILTSTARLKQQQNLYEAVRSDRNVYSKNLIDTQDMIKEMKRRFKIMNHQIEQLKEDITVKDHSLVKEHFHHHNADKEKESLKNEVTKIRKQIIGSENIVVNQHSEVQKLAQIIQEADDEKKRQIKEYDAIISERTILNRQLTKRNEELSSLYQKIQIQTSALHQGEIRYQTLQSQISGRNGLQNQVKQMEAELIESIALSRDSGNFKSIEHTLESDLLLEKTKVRVLIDELEVPLNIHRWRKLESSDPERLDMLKQIQSLQQRLIAKHDAIAQKDTLIQEKEELYVELKNVLSRQPGPEVSEQLSVYQDNLKAKVKQLKHMEDEMLMYRQQVNLFKEDIDTANRDMRDVNCDWLKQMEDQWYADNNMQAHNHTSSHSMSSYQHQQQYYASSMQYNNHDDNINYNNTSHTASTFNSNSSSLGVIDTVSKQSITAPST